MANLQVKNVPEDLHAELRRRAGLRHVTVRDYVLALIRKDQQVPTLEEWLDELDALPMESSSAPAVDVVALIREGRRERVRHVNEVLGVPEEFDDPQ